MGENLSKIAVILAIYVK